MSLIKDYFEKTKKHIVDFGELTIVLMQVWLSSLPLHAKI
jgi:hypothetical protein